ncbi:fimbrial protein [Dyella terrae]|uniref:fimbrial protein n=1 Tax=Dyella terrae TaxID=522259 RepID=UPI001EFCAA2C|nr:fimbrial protein [Dyella terrae]ULU26224.1 type 1 fimbrial protein [Dyella terrae]
MKKTLFSAALAAAFGLVAMQASASDGTITFNGEVTDVTCTVTGGGNATGTGNNITVNLPKVGVTSLSAAGATAGDTSFSLVLGGGTGCTNGKTASMWVDISGSSLIDGSTKSMKNDLSTGSTAQVRLLNGTSFAPIDLLAGTNQPTATIAANTATLNYVAQYLNGGAASSVNAGLVKTHLVFSMQYN